MARFENRQDVASKIYWEGGIDPALAYGITADDMPEGDTELTQAWTALKEAHAAFQKTVEVVEKLLPDPEGE